MNQSLISLIINQGWDPQPSSWTLEQLEHISMGAFINENLKMMESPSKAATNTNLNDYIYEVELFNLFFF